MSVTKYTIITCDSGLESCPGDSYAEGTGDLFNAAAQRASYTSNTNPDGTHWVYRNGKDYCPSCSKHLGFFKK